MENLNVGLVGLGTWGKNLADRLGPAGHLDGTIGIKAVDDVRWIGPGAKRLLAFDKGQPAATAEPVTYPIGFRGDLPAVIVEAGL